MTAVIDEFYRSLSLIGLYSCRRWGRAENKMWVPGDYPQAKKMKFSKIPVFSRIHVQKIKMQLAGDY